MFKIIFSLVLTVAGTQLLAQRVTTVDITSNEIIERITVRGDAYQAEMEEAYPNYDVIDNLDINFSTKKATFTVVDDTAKDDEILAIVRHFNKEVQRLEFDN